MNEDFEALGKADANDQAYWALEMESAIQAARHAAEAQRASTIPGSTSQTIDTAPFDSHVARGPLVDTEGSLRFRRRRK